MCRYCLIVLMTLSVPAHGGLFKCLQSDGSVIYQQTACPEDAQGGELSVDTSSPGGGSGASRQDYSVQSQLKAMESARAREQKARSKSAERTRKSQVDPSERYDRAKCAKHRAKVAQWRQDVRDGYHNQNEKIYEWKMLEHHQALVERYCPPE